MPAASPRKAQVSSHATEGSSASAHKWAATFIPVILMAFQKVGNPSSKHVGIHDRRSQSQITPPIPRLSSARAAPASMDVLAPTISKISTQQSTLFLDVKGNELSKEFWTTALRNLGNDGEVVGLEVLGPENNFSSVSGVVKVQVKEHAAENDAADSYKYQHMFVKRTEVQQIMLKYKSWTDIKRSLVKGLSEAVFYREFAPQLIEGGVQVPRLLNSEERFGMLEDPSDRGEPSADDLGVAAPGSVLVLQNIPDHAVFQNAPSAYQVRQALAVVAKLHAGAWERESLLTRASQRLPPNGGVWHLSIRNPKEITKLLDHWERFLHVFEGEVKSALREQGVDAADIPEELKSVGARLLAVHQEVSERMSAAPDSPHATLIHGDYKAMNVILADSSASMLTPMEDDSSVIIDFSHLGVGFGMSDVAFLMTHSVTPALLDNRLAGYEEDDAVDVDRSKGLPLGQGELQLVRDYYISLQRAGGKRVEKYSWDLAVRDYVIGLLDYGRFVITRFWADAGPDTFAKKAANPNVMLPNRDAASAVRFALHMQRCLSWYEENHMGEKKK